MSRRAKKHILIPYPLIRLGETIALGHHEKWDGSGYPNGLKGLEIPVAGRIVAIADVFDALTSRRPYKDPFSGEKSLAIIREGRGSHFDPDVVDAFFAIQGEILAIRSGIVTKGESLPPSRRSILAARKPDSYAQGSLYPHPGSIELPAVKTGG